MENINICNNKCECKKCLKNMKIHENIEQCRRCLQIGNKFQKNRRICTKCLSAANNIRMKSVNYNYYELNKEKVKIQQKKYLELKKNSLEIL